jgi:phosphatidylglycerophosphatase GEP4
MDMNTFNVSATLNVFRLITKPTLCLPHATISTFNHLPIPLNKAFGKYKNVDIRAVVLDKDNCFACPNSNDVHKPYKVRSYSSDYGLSLFCMARDILWQWKWYSMDL